ncbi:MAG: diacylglycerol kinase family lipid kinase [Candidatus Poribacteria bacterium]|nr:diacylglycerol kinase family lipid kinase [Candidatus Poribacteria bacterium]
MLFDDAPIPLIVNPAAGGGRGERIGATVAAAMRERGVRVEPTVTRSSGEVSDLIVGLAEKRAPVVLVCGGDGTIRAAANVLAKSETALGIVPGGRGNDLARALGQPISPRMTARYLARLLTTERTVKAIDLGDADGTYFCTVAAFGVDSEVSRRVREASRGERGNITYLAGVIAELANYDPMTVTISGDFGERTFDALLCATANTPNYGKWYRIAPDALYDDGKFHICAIRAMSFSRALALVPRVITGTHLTHPLVETLTTDAIRFETAEPAELFADGESLATTPVTLKIVPAALRVLASSMKP